MIELLILYSLSKQEQTLYGLRKTIAKHFGEISIPSHGALYPCIKKLEKINIISVRKKLSSGGRRYTFYNVNESFSEYFNNKFMKFNTAKSETLDSFLYWLKIHLNLIDIVENSLINEFKEKCLFKLDNYKKEIENKLNDEYIELTKIQKNILNIQLSDIEQFTVILNNL